MRQQQCWRGDKLILYSLMFTYCKIKWQNWTFLRPTVVLNGRESVKMVKLVKNKTKKFSQCANSDIKYQERKEVIYFSCTDPRVGTQRHLIPL